MNGPGNRPAFEKIPLLPLGLGIFSLLGICLLLMIGQLSSTRTTVPVSDTATSFKYLLLGTEPGISTADPNSGEEVTEENPDFSEAFPDGQATPTRKAGLSVTAQSGGISSSGSPKPTQNIPNNITPGDPVIIFSSSKTAAPTFPLILKTPTKTFTPRPTITSETLVKTPVTLLTLSALSKTPTPTTSVVNTATRTPTSASTAPLNPGTYDDTDSRLVYGGNWESQNNVSGAYQNTLHVSNISTSGNSITFRFIGTEVRLFYQSGSGLGSLNVNIDGQNIVLDQSEDETEWVSMPVVNGTHTVTITHASGGSVNLDYVIVPDLVLTSTPEP